MSSQTLPQRSKIERKTNSRKLRSRSQHFTKPMAQNKLFQSFCQQTSKKHFGQALYPDINQLQLNFSSQRVDDQMLVSTRFKISKIQIQNDFLRLQNAELKKQIVELKQNIREKITEQLKFEAQTCETISAQPCTQQIIQQYLQQIDHVKQVCQNLRLENHQMSLKLQNQDFIIHMLKRKMEWKPKPDYSKLRQRQKLRFQCKKCKDFREIRIRNKHLNQLVQSLNQRINRFSQIAKRGQQQEAFYLSPEV